MAFRRTVSGIVASLVLAACSAAPSNPPAADPVGSGPGAAVDEARSVANDLEERSQFIESQMRDPFTPP